jgi:alanine dehydrogenase
MMKRPMNIIVPRETYPLEKRVMVIPKTAKVLTDAGHTLFVQAGAGREIGISDENYQKAGARIIDDDKTLYGKARGGMIIKLKAPSPEEFSIMKDSILFCMLHLSQNKERYYHMGKQNLVGVVMEEICDNKGKRLIDQTDITGEAGVIFSTRYFQKMPQEMNAVILGYGNVSTGAMAACSKLGIKYKIIRKSEFKNLPKWLVNTDLLINGITWPENARNAGKFLVTREDIKNSKPGMIVLDLSVDFPSPIETCRPTTYENPTIFVYDRPHISIYGYPGLFPVTSSDIYAQQVLPIALEIANNYGLRAIKKVGELGHGIFNAIANPKKIDWRAHEPQAPVGSNIE